MDNKILTGLTQDHIQWVEPNKIGIHKEVASPLKQLQEAATNEGFDLAVCSGYRSFETQVAIWNGKVRGTRPVLDSKNQQIDISTLTPKEIIFSILRWSALPGLSRHHWGTDLDVFDKRTLPKNYKLQLIPDEFEGQGYFAPLHDWLDKNLSRFGFFRPYAKDLGGVSPERWHISYAPLSQQYFKALTLKEIEKVLTHSDFELKSEVMKNLSAIYEQFFLRVSP